MQLGDLGDGRSVGGAVSELRIDRGPGYCVYFAQIEPTLVLLRWEGQKRTQRGDIARAKDYLADYRERTR